MFDVLVGVNLLREGLDLPEVSLVAIIDADKGFLRSNAHLHKQRVELQEISVVWLLCMPIK